MHIPIRSTRRRVVVAATTGIAALAITAPIAGADAATMAAGAAAPAPPGLTFVPPSVGPICVTIGATIIGGHVINPGLHVCSSGASLPPIDWEPLS